MDSPSFRDRVESGAFDKMVLGIGLGAGSAFEQDVMMNLLESQAVREAETIASIGAEDSKWVAWSGGGDYGNIDLPQIQQMCWWYYRNSPFGKNIIENYTFLTVGEGFDAEFDKDADAKRWKDRAEEIGWYNEHRTWVRSTFGFGEVPLVLFPLTGRMNGKPGKKTAVRMYNPWQISDVVTKAGDPKAIRYYKKVDGSKINPRDVIHMRINYMGNYKRGLPVLLPVLKPLYYAQKFLTNRHWINHVRARIPAIRKVQGGRTQVQAEKARLQVLPKPGTYAIENKTTEWQYPDYKIHAADAKDDYRHNILAAASGVNLPEFLVHSTAENSAYASLLAQESPTVRMFQDFQKLFANWFRPIIAAFSETENFVMKIPLVVPRNLKEAGEAYGRAEIQGACSKRTYAEKLGLTWTGKDGELERMAEEGFSPVTSQGDFPGAADADEPEECLIQRLESDPAFLNRIKAVLNNGAPKKGGAHARRT